MNYQWYKQGKELLEEIRTTELPESMAALWYIGQMGVLVKWNGLTICVDPVLNDLKNPDGSSRRNYAPPFAPEELSDVDYVVCTHNHKDHMNVETLVPLWKAIPQVQIIVPEPERESLIAAGIAPESVTGAKAGEEIVMKNVSGKICPVAAAHETYITDSNGNQRNLGYVIKCGALNIFHAGDTVVTRRLIEDVRANGPVAVACVPVNGVDTERHERGIVGNMDCRDAAYFVQQIDADMALPMHTDMVMRNEEDPLIFAGYMRNLYPGRKYHIMQLGERMILVP
jgi:L-ascorbate metabolism protein UlaG (beta-lactamase superfamily)